MVRSSGAGMDVSPHMIASRRASWRKTYCGCVAWWRGRRGEGEGGRGRGRVGRVVEVKMDANAKLAHLPSSTIYDLGHER